MIFTKCVSLSNCNNDGYFRPNIAKPDINTSGKLYLIQSVRCSGIFLNSFLTIFNNPGADNVFLSFNVLFSGIGGNFFGILGFYFTKTFFLTC